MENYVVEILTKDLDVITQVRSLVPFNLNGDILQFSRELSDYGRARFRISADDPMLDTYGDILAPHKNHLRIRNGDIILWQGIIIENPKRNKSFIDVIAVEYLFYLDKIMVKRTSPDENGNAGIYRIFSGGTMATAITAILNESIAQWSGTGHALSGMTLGTIENPNYPPNMTTGYTVSTTQTPLTGPWYFGEGTATSIGPTYQFDFVSVLYVLKCFGIQTYADFYIDNNLAFHFKKFVGNSNNRNMVFRYGPQGNIVDYNLCRYGERMVNSLYNIATDENGVILHETVTNNDSVNLYGLMEGYAAYTDVKTQSGLRQRGQVTMPMVSVPDETNVIVYVDEKSPAFSRYSLGDIITISITNKGIDFDKPRRIVGMTATIHNTGRQMIAVQTNIPQDFQLNG